MKTSLMELEKEARALSIREKAALARTLLEDLDENADEGVEELWIEEASRRYRAYKTGELVAASGEEAIQRARQRVK